jgi:AAA+ ATPase superfamily predicted ATPase
MLVATSQGNPFRYGQIASGEYFADRDRETEQIVADALAGQNTVIISPRRYGKTSVALRARDRLVRRKALVAYADLLRATSKQRLMDELGTALYRGLGSAMDRARASALDLFRVLPLQPKLTAGKDGTPAVEFSPLVLPQDQDRAIEHLLALPQTFASERKRRVVVMLDEFQELVGVDTHLPALLRSVIQTQQDVAYVFLGSQQHLMTQVFTDRNQPLYRSARPLSLGPIPAADFRRYIRGRFESTDRWIEDAAIERVLEITAGHPHDTQELCHFVWDVGARDHVLVTASVVDEALRRVIAAEDAHYTTLWESLTRPQRLVVLALAREPGKGIYAEAFRQRNQLGSVGTVQKSLGVLLRRDVIAGSSVHGYSVPDAFLRAWIAAAIAVL